MNRELMAMQVMEAAMDLPSADQDAYVLDACNGDSQLLRKVRALLSAAEDETGFLATRSDQSAEKATPPVRERIGSYRILREIGRGGMGVVYEAEHDAMQRRVALKVLSAGSSPSDNQLARFYREARSAGQLHHTNIVPVFEVGSADNLHYYTMQFIEGANLDVVIDHIRALRKSDALQSSVELGRTVAQRLLAARSGSTVPDADSADMDESSDEHSRHHRFDSTDSVFTSPDWSSSSTGRDMYYRRIAAIGLQTAEALDFAHQNGTLHRDIKPANLMVDTQGIVWVLDFGLAKSGEDNLTMSGDVVGTIRYMAPERFDGKADTRSDIYSLGLTLYELATLEYAFDAKDRSSLIKQVTSQEPRSLRSIDRRVPRDLETIVLKSLDRNPNRRYQSAAEMAEDLRLFIMDLPIAARRISTVERAWRVCRRNPVVSSLAASLVVLLILVAVGASRFAYISNQQKNQALAAERSTRQRRYELNYQSARSIRQSDQLGRRFDALASIREAAEILPTLDLSAEETERERAKLRSEAVGALALFDIQPAKSWPAATQTEQLVAFNPEHTRFAQPFGDDGEIRVINVHDDSVSHVLRSEYGQTYDLLFNSDGRFLLSKNQRKGTDLSVWDLTASPQLVDGEQQPAITKPFLHVSSHVHGKGAFSSDGKTIALSEKKSVAIFDLPSGNRRATIETEYAPKWIQLSDDGRRLAACEFRGTQIDIWDVADPTEPPQVVLFPEGSQGTRNFTWSSERNTLLAGIVDGSILVWRHGLDKDPERFQLHKHTVTNIHLHPNQPWVFTQAWDETVRVFDLVTEQQVCRLERFGLQPSGFSTDGSMLGLSSAEDQRVGIWKLPKPCLSHLRFDNTGVPAFSVNRSAELHPQWPSLLLTANKERISLYDTQRQKLLTQLSDYQTSVAEFSADGSSLVIYSSKSSVKIPLTITRTEGDLEVVLGEPQQFLGPLPGASETFELSSDNKSVLVGFRGNAASSYGELISLVDGSRVRFGPHPHMTALSISPDGKWVATSCWRGRGIKIWEAATGEEKATLLPDTKAMRVKFSPDGKYLVAVQEEDIYVWQAGTWEPVHFDVDRHHGIMGYIDFTDRFFVADNTGYLPQLVDMQSKRWLLHFENNVEDIQRDYSFSKDGSQLVIGGIEYTHIWDLKRVREHLTEIGLGW